MIKITKMFINISLQSCIYLSRLSSLPAESSDLSPLMFAGLAAVGLGVATAVSSGLQVYLSIYLSIILYTYLSIYFYPSCRSRGRNGLVLRTSGISIYPTFLCILYFSIYLSTYLYIYISIYRTIYLSIYLYFS